MSWGGVNFLAVIMATVFSMALGAVWYGVFAKAWMAANGFTPDDLQGPDGKPKGGGSAYVVAGLSKFLMAFGLAKLLALTDTLSPSNGVAGGLFIWLCFVVTALAVGHRFQMKPWSLTVIDGGYWLAVLTLMGVIIGWVG